MSGRTLFLIGLIMLVLLGGCWSKTNIGFLLSPFGGNPDEEGFEPTPGEGGAFELYALEPGSLFGGAGPTLTTYHPQAGATGVDVNTLLIFGFSEAMRSDLATLQAGLTVIQTSDDSEVAGTFSTAPGSAGKVLVFKPAAALEENEEYEVTLANTLEDAQGDVFVPEGEDAEEFIFRFTTGAADAEIEFAIIESLIYPEPDATQVGRGAAALFFFTRAVNTADSLSGLGGSSANFVIEDEDANAIAGSRSFDYDNRLFVFTPTSPMPEGKKIDWTVLGTVKDGDDTDSLATGLTGSFTISGVVQVTAITFTDNDPLVALPNQLFDGRVNLANQDALQLTVTLAGTDRLDKLTLIFWDGVDRAIVLIANNSWGAGTQNFTVDLKPETTNALVDGTLTVGAYTSLEGVNGPVTPPLVLPTLKKDVVAPAIVQLGPPNVSGTGGLDLLTDLSRPGIHGRASEDLASIQFSVNFGGVPLNPVQGIKFFSTEYPTGSGKYSEEVTRGTQHLFITTPLDFTPAASFLGPASRADEPIVVTEITLTDLVGNTYTDASPVAANMDFRGFFQSTSTGTNELTLECYDQVTLLPILGVDLIVENLISSTTWGVTTDAEGKAGLVSLTANSGDAMLITAVKDGYQVLSQSWAYNAQLDFFYKTANLLLVPENEASAASTLAVVFGNATGVDLATIYMGGNELRTGTHDPLVDTGANPTSASLTGQKNRLQILQALGVQTGPPNAYQWAWSNPFVADQDMTQALVFTAAPAEPDAATENQPVVFPTVLGAGTTRRALLFAKLPGLAAMLPLGVDTTEEDAAGEYRFDIPLPPSLAVNEVTSYPLATVETDPVYELLLEPDLGPAANDAQSPSQTLLESLLFFEIEEVAAGATPPPPVIRKRFAYEQAKLGTVIADQDLPAALAAPVQVGPALQWTNVLFTPASGLFKLSLQNLAGSRHWVVYQDLFATPTIPASFTFPSLTGYGGTAGLTGGNDFTGFDDAGVDYPFQVEAFYIPSYTLSQRFISLIDREWLTYWRSTQMNFQR